MFGPSGVGKTSLALRLASEWGLPYIDMDQMYKASVRSEQPEQTFAASLSSHIDRDAWVMDGSYDMVQELYWNKATLLVWLDFSVGVVGWRMARRIGLRLIGRKPTGLAPGASRGDKGFMSIARSAVDRLSNHHRTRRRHLQMLYNLQNQPPYVHRLRTPEEVEFWLEAARSARVSFK